MSEEDVSRETFDWSELAIAVVRTGLMLVVVVMADPGLRWEAMIRAERMLKWWNRRRAGVPVSSLPSVPPPVVSALLEEARGIVRDSPREV